jgi:hypothetical protein
MIEDPRAGSNVTERTILREITRGLRWAGSDPERHCGLLSFGDGMARA